jgi:hypothetical protein
MTKLLRSFSSRNLLTLGALTIALAPQVLKAQGQCSNATMKGTYVASATGTVGSAPAFSPIATVGLVIYNGDGTGVSVFSTKTVGGQTSTSSNVTATFTVNPDCTGSKTIGATTFNFVITPDGSKITFIVTNPGVTLMGTGVRSLFLNSND